MISKKIRKIRQEKKEERQLQKQRKIISTEIHSSTSLYIQHLYFNNRKFSYLINITGYLYFNKYLSQNLVDDTDIIF